MAHPGNKSKKYIVDKDTYKEQVTKPLPAIENEQSRQVTEEKQPEFDTAKIVDYVDLECKRIEREIEKDAELDKIRGQIAALESQRFKNINFSNQCGYAIQSDDGKVDTQCEEMAPKEFPSTDVYICPKHLKEIGEKLHADLHNDKMQKLLKEINDQCSKSEIKIAKEIFKYADKVRDAFIDGSINNTFEPPDDYFSLLMTKLIVAFKQQKSSRTQKAVTEEKVDDLGKETIPDTVKQDIITKLIELLVKYRYVRNPTSLVVLATITLLITNGADILNAATSLVDAIRNLIETMNHAVLPQNVAPVVANQNQQIDAAQNDANQTQGNVRQNVANQIQDNVNILALLPRELPQVMNVILRMAAAGDDSDDADDSNDGHDGDDIDDGDMVKMAMMAMMNENADF